MPKGVFPRPPISERFWPKVKKGDGCWEWQGVLHSHGLPYGQFSIKHKTYVAHRIAWELVNGSIPSGMLVCHRCDNPRCVRPEHLFLGTYADNNRDMMAKGRFRQGNTVVTAARGERHRSHTRPEVTPRGEKLTRAGLTNEDVANIRAAYAAGESSRRIALAYRMSPSGVISIVRRKTWRHVP